MYRRFICSAAIFAFFYFAGFAQASGYFSYLRPFTVKDDLALEKSKLVKATSITQEILENYLSGDRNYSGVNGIKEEKEEKKWDELRYGNVYFRLSRYHDWKSSYDVLLTGGERSFWEKIKSFQWEGATNRETLETVGGILTPEFDLSIKF